MGKVKIKKTLELATGFQIDVRLEYPDGQVLETSLIMPAGSTAEQIQNEVEKVYAIHRPAVKQKDKEERAKLPKEIIVSD